MDISIRIHIHIYLFISVYYVCIHIIYSMLYVYVYIYSYGPVVHEARARGSALGPLGVGQQENTLGPTSYNKRAAVQS